VDARIPPGLRSVRFTREVTRLTSSWVCPSSTGAMPQRPGQATSSSSGQAMGFPHYAGGRELVKGHSSLSSISGGVQWTPTRSGVLLHPMTLRGFWPQLPCSHQPAALLGLQLWQIVSWQ
jgi:hypothetical protein